jgi:hypothetical protein
LIVDRGKTDFSYKVVPLNEKIEVYNEQIKFKLLLEEGNKDFLSLLTKLERNQCCAQGK